jgi:hypothetical protein
MMRGWCIIVSQALRNCAAVAVLAVLALGMSAGGAIAQRAGPQPCRQDVREFCTNHEPGHGAVQRCLQEHSGAVSSTCRAYLQERRERGPGRGATVRQVCRVRSGAVDCVEKRTSPD